MKRLSVIANQQKIGTVEEGRNHLVFRYAPTWQAFPGSFPLSTSMPLVQDEHPHAKIEPYLWNLLPDNPRVLEQWGKRFQVSHNNVFRLLEHVGEDCAGAIQFISEAREAELLDRNDEENVEWIDEADLANRTGKRPVSSRQEAMERWKEMAGDTTCQSQMLIYCQDPAPKDNGERQQHPFFSYAAVGASFPNPSRADDEYKMVCYGFLKDRVTEIDQLFANEEEPGFDLIDNLASGSDSHPRLQALFGTADASKIIPDFLVPPSASIQKGLNSTTDWLGELTQLLERTLGLQLNPKITKAAVVREKLWLPTMKPMSA